MSNIRLWSEFPMFVEFWRCDTQEPTCITCHQSRLPGRQSSQDCLQRPARRDLDEELSTHDLLRLHWIFDMTRVVCRWRRAEGQISSLVWNFFFLFSTHYSSIKFFQLESMYSYKKTVTHMYKYKRMDTYDVFLQACPQSCIHIHTRKQSSTITRSQVK